MKISVPAALKQEYADAFLRLRSWQPGDASAAARQQSLLSVGYLLGQAAATGGDMPPLLSNWIEGAIGGGLAIGAAGLVAGMRAWVNSANTLMAGSPHLAGLGAAAAIGTYLPWLLLAAVVGVVIYAIHEDDEQDGYETEEDN